MADSHPPETWGQQPYTQQPARPTAPTGLATAALVLAALLTLGQLVVAATSFAAADQYALAAEQGVGAWEVLTVYDLVSLPLLLIAVAAYVVTCCWLQRARKASAAVPGFALEHSRGPVWVWLGWWVPIVSFWFPYQVVRDIRDASGAPRTSVLGGWWACWVVWLVAGRVAGRLIPVDDVPDPALVELLPWVETAVATALLLALVFWVQLVRDIRDAQRTALG